MHETRQSKTLGSIMNIHGMMVLQILKNICKHKNVHKDSEITDALEHNSIPLNCGAYDSFLLCFFKALVIAYDLQCRPIP